mgnify:CR=1 FL=1
MYWCEESIGCHGESIGYRVLSGTKGIELHAGWLVSVGPLMVYSRLQYITMKPPVS